MGVNSIITEWNYLDNLKKLLTEVLKNLHKLEKFEETFQLTKFMTDHDRFRRMITENFIRKAEYADCQLNRANMMIFS